MSTTRTYRALVPKGEVKAAERKLRAQGADEGHPVHRYTYTLEALPGRWLVTVTMAARSVAAGGRVAR